MRTRGRVSVRARRQPSTASASSEPRMRLDIRHWPFARMMSSLACCFRISSVPSGVRVRPRTFQGFTSRTDLTRATGLFRRSRLWHRALRHERRRHVGRCRPRMRTGDVDGHAIDGNVLAAVPAESLRVGNTWHSLSSVDACRPQVKRRDNSGFQSVRNARSGSTRSARLAGQQAARVTVVAKMAIAARYAPGSRWLTP